MTHNGHELELLHDDKPIARPWGVYCKTCEAPIAACTNEQEAKSVLEWHQRITERLAKC